MSDQPASAPHPRSRDQHPYPVDQQNPYPQPENYPQAGPPAGYHPPYTHPETNIFAILAIVLAFFTGILGIVFGHIARHQIKRTGQAGNGLALAGLIVGYVWVAFTILAMIWAFSLGMSDPTLWEDI